MVNLNLVLNLDKDHISQLEVLECDSTLLEVVFPRLNHAFELATPYYLAL